MTASPSGERNLFRTPPGRHRLLNMTTGPVEVSPRVAEAQLAPLYTPHTPAFWDIHDETVALLRRVLKTRHLALPFHGSIRTGLDVALANFVRPGGRILAIENGYWGQLIGLWAETYGAEVTWLRGDPLAPVDPEAVMDSLDRGPAFDLVTLVHVETSSGVVNPVDAIGKSVRDRGALYFVDSACSAGAMPYDTDAWSIDIGVTGSHKCLASVPGLAIVTLSDRAFAVLEERRERPRTNYFDLRHWVRTTLERRETPPFTQPVGLILALRAALQELDEDGDARFSVHRESATAFMGSLRGAGLRMILDRGPAHNNRDAYSDTVLAVEYPPGVTDAAFRGGMLEVHGIAVIGNIGDFAGRSFRVGLMSKPQLEPANMERTLGAIRDLCGTRRNPMEQ